MEKLEAIQKAWWDMYEEYKDSPDSKEYQALLAVKDGLDKAFNIMRGRALGSKKPKKD